MEIIVETDRRRKGKRAKPKPPPRLGGGGFEGIGPWRCPRFAWGGPTLGSAKTCFTSEFGTGSGGSKSLWPPGKGWERRVCGPTVRETVSDRKGNALGCYMVKPHGQLVRVSCTCYHASTSRLSTLWSSTDLQGHRVPREILSWEGLPA